MKNINSILKEVLGRIKPSKEELQTIDKSLQDFIIRVQKNMKSQKINAEVFVGGSFAKDTMIRKGSYDIDIFIRFDKKHKDISNLTKKLLRNMKNV